MPKKNQEDMLMGSLPKGAQEHIKKYKIKMSRNSRRGGKKKYSGVPQFLERNEGFDLLENMLVVKKYICEKYEIKAHLLEILLYLYPRDYFTWYDYYEMPKYFNYNRISKLESEGIIRVVSKDKTKRRSLYGLTPKARNIVTNFYMFLFGEKKIPLSGNPLSHSTASAIDKMRFNLIKKINQKEPSESKKRYFK